MQGWTILAPYLKKNWDGPLQILKVVDLFPRKISNEVNESLLEEVTESEVYNTLSAFQK
jgi:hypothetical protein